MTAAWIDAHCDLANPSIRADLPALLEQLATAGCRALLLAGCAPADWRFQKALVKSYSSAKASPQLLPSFGIHPWTVSASPDEDLEEAYDLLQTWAPEAASLGEIGLDYFREKEPERRQRQVTWFKRQLQSPAAASSPLIIHCVRAHHDCLPLLKPRDRQGIIHSFWGPVAIARQYLDRGFLLSLPARIGKGDPHALLRTLPREQLLFESDSPQPLPQGGYSTPLILPDLFHYAATVWKEDPDVVIERQNRSLERLFPHHLQNDSQSIQKGSVL